MKKSLLMLSVAASLSLSSVAATFDATKEYYLIDSETGYGLTGGRSWGTQAVLKETGRAYSIIADGDGYKLKASVGYFKDGDNLYVDGNEGDAIKLTFTEIDGKYIISFGDKYLSKGETIEYQNENSWDYPFYMGENTIYLIDRTDDSQQAIKWNILSREERIEALNSASVDNPVDATFFIKGHNVEVNDDDAAKEAWNYNNPVANFVYEIPWFSWGKDENENGWAKRSTYIFIHENNVTADQEGEQVFLSQDVEGMPAGLYEARYRLVNQNNTAFTLKLNDTDAEVVDFEKSDLWYGSGYEYLHKYENTAKFTVGTDGKLSIKMAKTVDPNSQNRFAFKSIRINYLGDVDAGVDNVAADNTNAPVEYYNLQGMRVENPAPGSLYIKRQGNTVSKVVIR